MDLWFAVVLGIVQGLTEFLPISSTAHLRITPALLGQADPGAAYTAVIQLGTLAAVILYFARDLWAMVRGVLVDRRSDGARLALHVVVGTVPIGVAGILGKEFITGEARSLWVIATTLAVVGVVMWIADLRAPQRKTLPQLNIWGALLVGLAQACALIPGVSRSGATMIAALLIGLRRDDAARLSFLLSIPAIGAAGVFEMKDEAAHLEALGLGPVLVGTIVSAVVGYASIAWLLRWLRTRTLAVFSVYRLGLAALLVALLLSGVVRPLD